MYISYSDDCTIFLYVGFFSAKLGTGLASVSIILDPLHLTVNVLISRTHCFS